jgi:hypothetical protein
VTKKTFFTLFGIAVMVAALFLYFYVLGDHGLVLIRSGDAVAAGIGVAVLILPIIGVWIVYSTLRAGFEHQRLASRAREGGFDVDVSALPKMPSGRVEREAADALFAEVKAEWEADPDTWRSNYRLARAYDYAGDRSRARETMRRAVALERAERAAAHAG